MCKCDGFAQLENDEVIIPVSSYSIAKKKLSIYAMRSCAIRLWATFLFHIRFERKISFQKIDWYW